MPGRCRGPLPMPGVMLGTIISAVALPSSPEHRAIAQTAVAESLVLQKTSGVLPVRPGATILVAGDAANDGADTLATMKQPTTAGLPWSRD